MVEPYINPPNPTPCIGCEGTGITHEEYAGHLCADCGGSGVYEQPIENYEGVFLIRHRAGCQYNEAYKKLIADGLNPHRHQPDCQCDGCRDCVRLEDKLDEYLSEEALGNVGLY